MVPAQFPEGLDRAALDPEKPITIVGYGLRSAEGDTPAIGGGLGAALRFGPELSGRFWVARSGGLVAELDKRAGTPLDVAVAPGVYQVVQSGGGAGARAAEARAPFGGRAEVNGEDMVPVRRVKAVLRGETRVVARPWTVVVRGSVGTNWLEEASAEPGVSLRLGRRSLACSCRWRTGCLSASRPDLRYGWYRWRDPG